MLPAALKAHCLAHSPSAFLYQLHQPGCLQGGSQQQQTAAAGATREHPLTDLGSQAGTLLSATFVETASESDIVALQEREGDIEEPGSPGGSKVSQDERFGGCGWEGGSTAGHKQCCILPGWPGRAKVLKAMATQGKETPAWWHLSGMKQLAGDAELGSEARLLCAP